MENTTPVAASDQPETTRPDMELPPLPRRLNHGNAEAFLAQCVQGLYLAGGPGKQVVIDGRQLEDFDSSAIAVLVGLRRRAGWQVVPTERRRVPRGRASTCARLPATAR